jgi:hypothetical protein
MLVAAAPPRDDAEQPSNVQPQNEEDRAASLQGTSLVVAPDIARLKMLLPTIFFGLSTVAISTGYELDSAGRRRMAETDVFKWDNVFLKLRYRCFVSGVSHVSTTEVRTQRHLDGIEREYFVCLDSIKYNFSIGADPRLETSGTDRVQWAARRCEALDEENLQPKRHQVGDQVDCWRPKKNLLDFSVDTRACGEPVCTLAHVYSCTAIDCVQLTSPRKQFSSVFGGDVAIERSEGTS